MNQQHLSINADHILQQCVIKINLNDFFSCYLFSTIYLCYFIFYVSNMYFKKINRICFKKDCKLFFHSILNLNYTMIGLMINTLIFDFD